MRRFAAFLVATLTLAAAASAAVAAQKAGAGAVYNHQALHVRDLPKSAAFYEQVLGLKRIPDPFNDDRHVFLQMGVQSELHLIGGAAKVEKQDIDHHMAFSVASLDDFIARLRSLKVKYFSSKSEEGQITTRPDGVKQVYFQDPDGYWIEVNDAARRR